MKIIRSATQGAGVIGVTSEMGTAVGDTAITLNNNTGTLKYVVAASATIPTYLQDLTAWTDFTGADITATTGHFITVARVDSTNRMIAYGVAEILSGALGSLTVASAEGEAEGDTLITITGATGTFVYSLDTVAYEPNFREELTEGWTAIESGDEIAANEDDTITVCLINDDNECLAVGSDTIVDIDTDTLTVTSVAGTEIGDTNITFSPDEFGVYVYKIAESAITPTYRQVLTTGWTNIISNTDITATTGQFITVALIDSNDRMMAFGTSEITSKSA